MAKAAGNSDSLDLRQARLPSTLPRVRKRVVKGAFKAFEAEFFNVGGWTGRQRPTAEASEPLGGSSGSILPRKQRHLCHRAWWPCLQGPGVTVGPGAFQGGRRAQARRNSLW